MPSGYERSPLGAQRPTEAGVGPVGDHCVGGPELVQAAVGLVLHQRAPGHALLHQRLEGLDALQNGGAGLLGPLGHQLVEVVTGDDVAVAGVAGTVGPLQLQGPPEGDRAQALEAVVAGQHVGQTHVVELLDRAWGEPVAAGLHPGEGLLLHHHHVVTGLGQPIRAGRSRGTTPHDEDLVARPVFQDAVAGAVQKRRQSPSRSKVTTASISASVSWPSHAGMPPVAAMC